MSIEKNPTGVREMAILLYDRMSVLDAIGPYEVLRSVPGVRVRQRHCPVHPCPVRELSHGSRFSEPEA